ncbi:hypothetical protein RHMOL_Rhmol06G0205400 [Rhododendron molle]|uniref:Uncharacterized protein n=1 Tax=Rhododendron molle TaxID=49168 RepID=A0ACC0NF99_RHOML|nr:hypothetical protein RHMOL_Rhmol06G0205400 [Rhododendron molle]
MTQDQSSSTLDTKASPRFECIKTTPKKDEEKEGIEDADGVDEDIDHETLAIDVEKLEENANNSEALGPASVGLALTSGVLGLCVCLKGSLYLSLVSNCLAWGEEVEGSEGVEGWGAKDGEEAVGVVVDEDAEEGGVGGRERWSPGEEGGGNGVGDGVFSFTGEDDRAFDRRLPPPPSSSGDVPTTVVIVLRRRTKPSAQSSFPSNHGHGLCKTVPRRHSASARRVRTARAPSSVTKFDPVTTTELVSVRRSVQPVPLLSLFLLFNPRHNLLRRKHSLLPLPPVTNNGDATITNDAIILTTAHPSTAALHPPPPQISTTAQEPVNLVSISVDRRRIPSHGFFLGCESGSSSCNRRSSLLSAVVGSSH